MTDSADGVVTFAGCLDGFDVAAARLPFSSFSCRNVFPPVVSTDVKRLPIQRRRFCFPEDLRRVFDETLLCSTPPLSPRLDGVHSDDAGLLLIPCVSDWQVNQGFYRFNVLFIYLTVLPDVRGARRMNHPGHVSLQIDSLLFESLMNQI